MSKPSKPVAYVTRRDLVVPHTTTRYIVTNERPSTVYEVDVKILETNGSVE